MDTQLLIAITVTVLASMLGGFTQRVSGFGYGIVVMMFFPYVLGMAGATALSGVVSIAQAIIVTYSLRSHINPRQVFIPLIPYTLTSLVGTLIVAGSDTSTLKRVLGGFLIALSIYFFFFSSKIRIKASTKNGIIAGSLSGIMSGLFAMGGPPVVVYYLSAADSTDDYLATIQCYFLFSNIIATVQRAFAGAFTTDVLILIVPAISAMVIASLLGRLAYKRLSPSALKKAIYAFMALSGLLALLGL